MPIEEDFLSSAAGDVSAAFGVLSTDMRRLATGLRVQGAADDAAGLAIRELLRADLATVRQASRNLQDGVSMLQLADGAAGTAGQLLGRMKELATQASGSTLSEQQKNILQREFDQLSDEVAAIGQRTTFNGIDLFSQSQRVDIALDGGQTIRFDTESLPAVSADLMSDPHGAAAAVDAAIQQVGTMRGNIGATVNRLQSAGQVADVQAESILASESRISDADVARQVAELTRQQVVAHGAAAMQAHSRTVAEIVTMLLG